MGILVRDETSVFLQFFYDKAINDLELIIKHNTKTSVFQ